MLKRLAEFFLIGGLLFIGVRGFELLTTNQGAARDGDIKAHDSAVATEELLLQYAQQMAWAQKDPVIYQHVIRNMRIQEDSSQYSRGELFKMADSIGFLKQDPVVRARLIYLARKSLMRIQPDQVPSEAQVEEYLNENPQDYIRPRRYRFAHVFFSAAIRGEKTQVDADEVFRELSKKKLSSVEAYLLGDPLLRSRAEEVLNEAQLERRYGTIFKRTLSEAKIGTWTKPIKTRFGLHVVRVEQVHDKELPAVKDVSNQILGQLLKRLEQENFQRGLAALRRRAN